jgi:putative transcriptional regulator
MEELRVDGGSLLAAWPDLLDPNFMHSVVLVCRHTADGAYGLVVNRETEHGVRDLLPDHPTLGKVDFPVNSGGPVDPNTLQFVHDLPEEIPGGLPLAGRVHLGGDVNALGRWLLENPDSGPERVRLYVGYSGWGEGQLEGELRGGSWLPAPPDPGIVFARDAEFSWRRVVRAVAREGAELDEDVLGVLGLEDLPPETGWN